MPFFGPWPLGPLGPWSKAPGTHGPRPLGPLGPIFNTFLIHFQPFLKTFLLLYRLYRPSESGHTLLCPNPSVRPNPAIPFCVRIRPSVSEICCSEIGIFPISEQKSTLPGKVHFFKKCYFAGQSNTFSKSVTLQCKVGFCSEIGIF